MDEQAQGADHCVADASMVNTLAASISSRKTERSAAGLLHRRFQLNLLRKPDSDYHQDRRLG